MIAACVFAMAAFGTAPMLTVAKTSQPPTILAARKPGSKLPQRLPASGVDHPTAPDALSVPRACSSTISAGDAQLRAALARANYGVDGSGVKVGVLSNSYDQNASAVTHAADDIASGDLPGAGNPCGRLTPVSVISNSLSIHPTENTDEGRAMLQIVHDLAPGATLGFASGSNGIYGFADNIRNLRAWGADIIVDDVSYSYEPAFQEGPVSVAISEVVGSGALYFTSAGNGNYPLSGKNVTSYEATAFRPVHCPMSMGPSFYESFCHNFNANGGIDSSNSITLSAGGQAQLILQWAQPWNGVTTDLDFYILDSSNNLVAGSRMRNTIPNSTISASIPWEGLNFTNSTGSIEAYRIVIVRNTAYGGDTGAPRLKYYFAPSTYGLESVEYSTTNGGDTVGPTLAGHSATEYGLSVGAAPYNDDVNPEYFSSYGPAVHYFGPVLGSTPATAITPLTLPGPAFIATDGGCTTFFSAPLDAGCYRFYGAAAAAAHAAAVAALMKQRSNELGTALSSNTTRLLLQNSAQAMSGGYANSTGAGLIDANAALSLIKSTSYAYMPAVSSLLASIPIASPWLTMPYFPKRLTTLTAR